MNINIKYKQTGSGWLTRDKYKFSPSVRAFLERNGNETITDIKIYRYPLTTLTKIANFFSGQQVPYDELMHLGIQLNNAYNIDKDSILSIRSGSLDSNRNGFEVIDIGTPKNKMTINELLDKTRNRMGDNAFYNYEPLTYNCQNFTMNLLKTLGLYNGSIKNFVYQDLDELKNKLPSITKNITGAVDWFKRFFNRRQEGEGLHKTKKTILLF